MSVQKYRPLAVSVVTLVVTMIALVGTFLGGAEPGGTHAHPDKDTAGSDVSDRSER
jgi:hypothetical protein